MATLTRKQQQILNFIERWQRTEEQTPTYQEIADEFGFKSLNSVTEHVRLLQQKGFLETDPGRARSLRVVSPLDKFRSRIVDIPIFGSIPAGFGDRREQEEAEGCVRVDLESIGIKPSMRTLALKVRGDSMNGKHILDGDIVIVEHNQNPRNGDVVAALIDGDSTLKTYIANNGKPYLQAENPKYPKLIPFDDLQIQGVMVALIRKRK